MLLSASPVQGRNFLQKYRLQPCSICSTVTSETAKCAAVSVAVLTAQISIIHVDALDSTMLQALLALVMGDPIIRTHKIILNASQGKT